MRKLKLVRRKAKKRLKPLEVLLNEPGIGRMSEEQRKQMTISCRDTDYIPKVAGAGSIKDVNGRRIQILHNGLKVEADGYVGRWMTEIITALKGHHEPQEEKAFYEVLKHLDKKPTMIELGSYWSYYSLWLSKEHKGATTLCCEPDPTNRALGMRNAELNNTKGIKFIEAAAGSADGKIVNIEMDSQPGTNVSVPVRSIDSLVEEFKFNRLDILHMDVQGVELDALEGALQTIKSGKLRFVFVSTHHYLFSGTPTTHNDCLKFIENLGGHIIASHTIPESFSGDGLIVASFDKRDKNFTVDTSINHTDRSLFRSYETDLQILINYYSDTINN